MGQNKIYFISVAALLAVHMILAENSEDPNKQPRWSVGFSFHRAQNLSQERLSHEERPRHERAVPFVPSFGSCNYTVEPGLTCADCNTPRLCLPNNVGIRFICTPMLPNCNGGICSATPSSSCGGQ